MEELNEKLYKACYEHDIYTVKKCIKEGANVNYIGNRVDDTKDTPLHTAVIVNDLRIVKELLNVENCEVDIVAPEPLPVTPLELACAYGRIDITNELLDRGANIHRLNIPYGENLLSSALRLGRGRIGVIELLLRRGIVVNSETAGENVPLRNVMGNCAFAGDLKSFKLLLNHGGDIYHNRHSIYCSCLGLALRRVRSAISQKNTNTVEFENLHEIISILRSHGLSEDDFDEKISVVAGKVKPRSGCVIS